uniref:Uncharacterized protein n=1 Tax=viral metagenome TaxID=1070528 RepID=A0A6M3LPT2_9ZZZZ
MKTTNEIPVIVKRAMLHPITDIGQLTIQDKKHLQKYVKMGVLIKGKGGPFPKLKTVYALIGHDIELRRKIDIAEMMRIAKYESKINYK